MAVRSFIFSSVSGHRGRGGERAMKYNMVRPVQRRRCRSSHQFVTRQMGLRLSLTLALRRGSRAAYSRERLRDVMCMRPSHARQVSNQG